MGKASDRSAEERKAPLHFVSVVRSLARDELVDNRYRVLRCIGQGAWAMVYEAVDNQQEAQQFTLPVMLPLLISYFALFLFILTDPHSTASFWFSIIPFTSPIAMVGRLGFNPPLWQLILSQVLLIAGFIFTTWVASRIYRIGILTHGSKVNFKVLAKWFMMKS